MFFVKNWIHGLFIPSVRAWRNVYYLIKKLARARNGIAQKVPKENSRRIGRKLRTVSQPGVSTYAFATKPWCWDCKSHRCCTYMELMSEMLIIFLLPRLYNNYYMRYTQAHNSPRHWLPFLMVTICIQRKKNCHSSIIRYVRIIWQFNYNARSLRPVVI